MRRGQTLPPHHSAKDGRLHERHLLRICGLAAVRAVFERDPGRVERLFFEDRLRGEVGEFCQALARARKPYRQVAAAELARVAGTVLHGGVVAITHSLLLFDFDPEAAREWGQDGTPLLILDGVGNPHNLGAIVRSAAFFGIRHIVLANRPEQAHPSDASYRVAEGGFEHVSLYKAAIPAALHQLHRIYDVIGTALGKRAAPHAWTGARPIALVLGNEETGLDEATIAACDAVVTIPGSGRVQSLNVAAAGAILMYLLTRS
jgi:RNA methyltransferase, TrmH family